jgi:hypothetical protein
MKRKPLTVRQAVITAAALAAGSSAAALTDTLADHAQLGVAPGNLAAALTAIWVLDKLNSLIEDKAE